MWSNLVYSIGILGLLEWFVPVNTSNESTEDTSFPDAILVLHVVFQILALSALFYSIHTGIISGGWIIGAAISTGVHSGSSAIVSAHEMIHRKHPFWQFCGKFLLFTAGNIYFYLEHLKVHHKWVGTPKDPATARKGEGLHGFFFRSVIGQIKGSWILEKERIRKEQKSIFSFGNYFLNSVVLLFLTVITLYHFLSPIAAAAFMLQVLVANYLLEYTNYIEHYGLIRNADERVNVNHSWQSDKITSRFTLLDLSRHSDHHYFASKPYHTLKSYPDSPVLPGGYASAFFIAFFPPLWFKIVDKEIEKYHREHASGKERHVL